MPQTNAPKNRSTHAACPACALTVHLNCHAALGARCGCHCQGNWISDGHADHLVARGIARLSGAYPANWLERLDAVRLDMCSVTADVLGQIHGTYGYGIDALGLDEAEALACGFDCLPGQEAILAAAWARAIGRLQVDQPKPVALKAVA